MMRSRTSSPFITSLHSRRVAQRPGSAEGMDEEQKRVLRRKRAILAETIDIDEDMLESLKEQELLTDDDLKQIDFEKGKLGKMTKVIDAISVASETAWDTFCFIISNKYVWLKKDLEAELKVERGDIEIDEDIIKESSMITHRKFGTSKRLCETDKKDIADLIALKLQLNKEEWEREMEKVKAELKEKTDLNKEKDIKSNSLIRTLKDYLKNHREQLESHAHDMTSTSEALQLSLEDANRDLLGKYEMANDRFLKRITQILSQRDLLLREREKCLRLLGEKDEKRPLDEVIKAKITSKGKTATAGMVREDSTLKEEIANKDRLIKRLNKTVTDNEHTLEEKDQEIEKLKEQLAAKEAELQKAHDAAQEATNNVAGLTNGNMTSVSKSVKRTVKKKQSKAT